MKSILLFIFLSAHAFAQVVSVDIQIMNEQTGLPFEGAYVVVSTGEKELFRKSAGAKGRVPLFDLPVGSVYSLAVTAPGFVPKIAEVNAYAKFPEDLQPLTPISMQCSLFPEDATKDFSFMKTQPMIKWFFVEDYGYMDFDKKYTQEMLRKIVQIQDFTKSRTTTVENYRKEPEILNKPDAVEPSNQPNKKAKI